MIQYFIVCGVSKFIVAIGVNGRFLSDNVISRTSLHRVEQDAEQGLGGWSATRWCNADNCKKNMGFKYGFLVDP